MAQKKTEKKFQTTANSNILITTSTTTKAGLQKQVQMFTIFVHDI